MNFYSLFLTHLVLFFFFFNDPATTEIYTLSLHDALPIYRARLGHERAVRRQRGVEQPVRHRRPHRTPHRQDRSEEHTSELQSQFHLVCRLLLEKKKKIKQRQYKNILTIQATI